MEQPGEGARNYESGGTRRAAARAHVAWVTEQVTDRRLALLAPDPALEAALREVAFEIVAAGSPDALALHPALERADDLVGTVKDVVTTAAGKTALAIASFAAPRGPGAPGPVEVLRGVRDGAVVRGASAVGASLCLVIAGDGEPADIDEAMLVEQLLDQVSEHLHAEHRSELDDVRRSEVERLTHLRSAHKRQMAALRASTRYKIGNAIVRSARSKRELIRLPSTLYRLYRERNERDDALETEAERVELPPRRPIRVATILDEFSERCFGPEAALVPLPFKGWKETLAEKRPEFLLVESAWLGNAGQWRYTINQFANRNPNVVLELLEWCHARGIPTVFWNKEDPANFDVFIAAARHFDHVLTTDAAILDKYREVLGHSNVGALPFAAQPLIHNPIGRGRGVLERVCFAGSWRGGKYAQRARDFEILLDPVLELRRLDIFDRNAGTDKPDLAFPAPYSNAVRGSLSYQETLAAYRRYAAFLNVNSVTESPTMFSRRVFELLACRTPVISTWSAGIEEMLGDVVITVRTPEETREATEQLIFDPLARDRLGQRGHRKVMKEHTYSRRFDDVLTCLGLPALGRCEPLVSVLCVSNRPQQIHHCIESYRKQTYPNTELIFVMNSPGFDRSMVQALVSELPTARAIFVDDAATLGDCLNEALAVADGEYFAKFDDDDHYGAEYLTDLMLAFEYSGAAVVGKRSHYVYLEAEDRTVLRFPGQEYTDIKHICGATIVADRRATSGIRFTPVAQGTDSLFRQACTAAGLRIFAADRFNFAVTRHADLTRHTWQVGHDEILQDSEMVSRGFPTDVVDV